MNYDERIYKSSDRKKTDGFENIKEAFTKNTYTPIWNFRFFLT